VYLFSICYISIRSEWIEMAAVRYYFVAIYIHTYIHPTMLIALQVRLQLRPTSHRMAECPQQVHVPVFHRRQTAGRPRLTEKPRLSWRPTAGVEGRTPPPPPPPRSLGAHRKRATGSRRARGRNSSPSRTYLISRGIGSFSREKRPGSSVHSVRT